MEPTIEIRNLRKTYGEKVAVDDVSLTIERGEIFGILGPNGAGKTTTVECLAGLRQADAGTIRLLGADPQRDPAAIRERLGIQLQESQLPPKLRVKIGRASCRERGKMQAGAIATKKKEMATQKTTIKRNMTRNT